MLAVLFTENNTSGIMKNHRLAEYHRILQWKLVNSSIHVCWHFQIICVVLQPRKSRCTWFPVWEGQVKHWAENLYILDKSSDLGILNTLHLATPSMKVSGCLLPMQCYQTVFWINSQRDNITDDYA